MATRAMVMSPLHNIGLTTVAAIIAHGVTFHGRTSLLMYTDEKNPIPQYMSLDEVDDPTRSVVQAEKLLRQKALDADDILQYTHDYSKNAHVLHTGVKGITDLARGKMVTHLMNVSPTDVVVIDNSADLSADLTTNLLEHTDVLFIVSDNSPKCRERVRQWLNHPTLKGKSDIYVITNFYNEVLGAVRPMAKEFGITPNRLCKLHYNPWLPKMCSMGHLQDVVPCAMRWDPRVANLYSDIDEIFQCFESAILTGKGR